jgi:hypothetical protein
MHPVSNRMHFYVTLSPLLNFRYHLNLKLPLLVLRDLILRSANLYRLAYVLVILAGFWLRIFDLDTLPGGLHFDEARNYLRAWRVAEGYGFPYPLEDIPEPFDGYVRGMFFQLAGTTLFVARLFTVFLNVIAVAATIGTARALYWQHPQRERIALVAGLALAVLPSSVILGRSILRANWVLPMSMLALMFLAWGWRTRKSTYYAAASAFTALAAIFYLGGLFFPPTVAVLMLVMALIDRRNWPGIKNWLVMGLAGGIVLLPWLYLYATLPEWLEHRTGAVYYEPSLSDPLGILEHLEKAFRPIYWPYTEYPERGVAWAARYNTFITGYLNPVLALLFFVGLVTALKNWHHRTALVAPLVMLGMMVPGLLTVDPAETTRQVGIFGPISLVAAFGAGWLFERLGYLRGPLLRNLALLFLVLLLVISPVHTYLAIDYHWHDEPKLFDEPLKHDGFDWNYHVRLHDMLAYVADAQHPIYFPLHILNYATSAAYSRTVDFPSVNGYDGRALPGGEIIAPHHLTYGAPEVKQPTTYVLALPDKGEMIILPAFKSNEDYQSLVEHVRRKGKPVRNARGWELGYSLMQTGDEHLLTNKLQALPHSDEPLAVFDGVLELLDIRVPANLTPGEWTPVTLYWQLREAVDEDYFVYFELRQFDVNRRGGQDDYFTGILRWFYPTAMWQPGEIITDVRWLYVFPDAPEGGYRFGLQVHTFPGPELVDFSNTYGTRRWEDWLIAGRTAILDAPFPEPGRDALEVDAVLSDIIRLSHVELSQPLQSLSPGDTLDITLYWETLAPPPEDYIIFANLFDGREQSIDQEDVQPLDGRYPTSTWDTSTRVVTTHSLTVPDGAIIPYTLYLGMYSYPTIERLDIVQAGVASPDDLIILQ